MRMVEQQFEGLEIAEPSCELCDKPATVRMMFHRGRFCNAELACQFHADEYAERVHGEMRVKAGIWCVDCKREFYSEEEWCQISPISGC